MNNYAMLIGRIVNELTIDSDTKNCEITIAINRAFKNEDGIYETDLIPVILKGLKRNSRKLIISEFPSYFFKI